MRFLLFLPGFFFLVLSSLLTIREASRSSRKSSGQKPSAAKPPKPTGTAAQMIISTFCKPGGADTE